jgi:hypothetical protein
MVLRVFSSSTSNLLIKSVKLRADLGRGETQLGKLCRACFGAREALAEATGGGCHPVEITQHLELSGQERGLRLLGSGAQKQPWVFQQTLTHFLRALREGRAQLTHLAAAQPGLGDGRGQTQAVFSVATGDRHQVAHGRMGRDGAVADLILDLEGKLADQSQAPRDPAHALVHPPGQILLAQPLAAKHRQQPALLQLREPL